MHLYYKLTLSMFQIMRDPETGQSKGFAFINFASFDASDAAMEAMNGQFLCNRTINVSYAFKKDSKGERHGSAAGNEISCFTCFIGAIQALLLIRCTSVAIFTINIMSFYAYLLFRAIVSCSESFSTV